MSAPSALLEVEHALAGEPTYTLDVGDYRYAVQQGYTVKVRCTHLPSGVVAEAERELQHDARMAARPRVDEIRKQEGLDHGRR